MTPDVSVVVPVHNAEKYLARTHQQLSALDPRVRYEFVLIDDHSIDASSAILETWRDSLPGPVTILAAVERGVARARNQALRACSGSYVWLTDADDEWSPVIVSSMLRAARTNGADVVACNAVKRSSDGHNLGSIVDATRAETTSGPEAFVRLLEGRLQGHLWNKLFDRSILGDDPFPSTRAHSDLGGMLNVLPAANTVAYVPDALYVYRQNPGSILNSRVYDSADLRSCLELAERQARALDPALGGGDALLQFKYRNIVLPILNELARRKSLIPAGQLKAERNAVAKLTSWHAVRALAASGHRRFSAQSALATASASAYVLAYALSIRVRRRRPSAQF
jgi:glycosyltransferase involved in cell wall biosynthesis